MSPGPDEVDAEVPPMDPAILIFLLYLMIIHELVSGWMEYQKQVAKPKKPSRHLWASRSSSWVSRSGFSQPVAYPVRQERPQDWRKPGRILRKCTMHQIANENNWRIQDQPYCACVWV